MKLAHRVAICLLIAAMLAVGAVLNPPVTAYAQDSKCFGLIPADCTLLNSVDAKGKLASFNMDYELAFTLTGTQSDDVDVSVKGSGPFEFDRNGAGLGGFNPAASEDAVDKLTMSNTIAWSVKAKGNDNSGNFEFRILDGTLYFQGDNATKGKWYSVDLKKAISSRALGRTGFTGSGGNPLAMLSMLSNLQKIMETPGFLKIERAADTPLENQKVATFIYHFELPTLFKSPSFVPLVKAMMAQSPNGSKMTDAQLKAISARLAIAFKDTSFSLTRMVGVTDKLPHGFGVDLKMKLDPKTLQALGGNGLGASSGPLDMNLHFLITLTGIGSKANVTAPAGAMPFSLGGEAEATPEATAAQ